MNVMVSPALHATHGLGVSQCSQYIVRADGLR